MARSLRIFSNSKVYHIIIKGIDNQDIFYDDQDRRVFLKHLSITKKDYDYKIYSYCLMDNHVHMIIRIEKEFLSKAIQSLMVRYVHYFNTKYKRIGTLVQNRFKSKNIENERYFLEVCRYVHRNPENAGIAKTEEYAWSSYQEYIGKNKYVDKDILLHYFNDDINEFIKYTLKCNNYEYLRELAEYELIQKLTDADVSEIIMKLFSIQETNEIPYFFKNLNKRELENAIEELKKINGSNKTQIARIIRISRRIIARIWEKE